MFCFSISPHVYVQVNKLIRGNAFLWWISVIICDVIKQTKLELGNVEKKSNKKENMPLFSFLSVAGMSQIGILRPDWSMLLPGVKNVAANFHILCFSLFCYAMCYVSKHSRQNFNFLVWEKQNVNEISSAMFWNIAHSIAK